MDAADPDSEMRLWRVVARVPRRPGMTPSPRTYAVLAPTAERAEECVRIHGGARTIVTSVSLVAGNLLETD